MKRWVWTLRGFLRIWRLHLRMAWYHAGQTMPKGHLKEQPTWHDIFTRPNDTY